MVMSSYHNKSPGAVTKETISFSIIQRRQSQGHEEASELEDPYVDELPSAKKCMCGVDISAVFSVKYTGYVLACA
jgi:hypothetical protein